MLDERRPGFVSWTSRWASKKAWLCMLGAKKRPGFACWASHWAPKKALALCVAPRFEHQNRPGLHFGSCVGY